MRRGGGGGPIEVPEVAAIVLLTITQIDIYSHQIQSQHSSDCGEYCIFYLYHRVHDSPLPEINKALRMRTNPALFVATLLSKLRTRISLCSLAHYV